MTLGTMVNNDYVVVKILSLRLRLLIDDDYVGNNRIYLFATLLTIPLLVMMAYAMMNLRNCLVLAKDRTRRVLVRNGLYTIMTCNILLMTIRNANNPTFSSTNDLITLNKIRIVISSRQNSVGKLIFVSARVEGLGLCSDRIALLCLNYDLFIIMYADLVDYEGLDVRYFNDLCDLNEYNE